MISDLPTLLGLNLTSDDRTYYFLSRRIDGTELEISNLLITLDGARHILDQFI